MPDSAQSKALISIFILTAVTATAPDDYESAAGTLTFAPGVTKTTISLIIKGDGIDEENETFTLNLSNASNATIEDGTSIITIQSHASEKPYIITIPLVTRP